MKKHLNLLARLSGVLTLVAVLLTPAVVNAFSAYGAGTSVNPYRISTCAQLEEIDNNLAGYYTLVSNIDCSGVAFTTLALSGNFTGTLDGLNHTISNLSIASGNGLFYGTLGATIKNITIASGTVSGNGNVGSFVGFSRHTTLDNVHSSMTVSTPTTSAYVGGLVGASTEVTVISKSSYSGTVSGGSYIGGLVGYQGNLTPTADVLTDSYFDGTLNIGDGSDFAGGVMGILYSGTVKNTYSTGTINMTGTVIYVGGFIGLTYKGATNNNFSATLINGTGTHIGAFFGIFFATTGSFSSTRSNNYFDQYRANGNDAHSLVCAEQDEASGDCTAVNAANATPSYFKNNHTNAPLNHVSWDFTNTWSITSTYPALQNTQLFGGTTGIPNNGDANGDGVNDSYQGNVLSVVDADGVWTTVTVPSSSGCTLGNGTTTTNRDSSYTALSSLTGFYVYCPTTGSTVPVTIIYDKTYTNPILRYYNASTTKYSTVSGVVLGAKTVGGIAKTTVTYNLTDGGQFDSDGVTDGIIIDPIGISSGTLVNTGQSLLLPLFISSSLAIVTLFLFVKFPNTEDNE